jgi:hypothetical protein
MIKKNKVKVKGLTSIQQKKKNQENLVWSNRIKSEGYILLKTQNSSHLPTHKVTS